jgi:predicted RND superfamily exporter protein
MIDLVERLVGFRFNKRGRIVVGFIIFAIFLALFAFFNDITTPEQCKVPVEEMSTFCKNLLYP